MQVKRALTYQNLVIFLCLCCKWWQGFRRMLKFIRLNCSINVQHKLLTGSIASAHSPCPLWSSLTLSASSVMRTKSPTTNWDEHPVPDKVLVCNAVFGMSAEGDIIVEEVRDRTLSADSEELVTLVKIAGLKVHLKNEHRKGRVSMIVNYYLHAWWNISPLQASLS